jgi:hypothetical protein
VPTVLATVTAHSMLVDTQVSSTLAYQVVSMAAAVACMCCMLVRMLSQLSDYVNRVFIIAAILLVIQALAVLEIKTEALENGLVQARSEVSRDSMYFVAHCMFFCFFYQLLAPSTSA